MPDPEAPAIQAPERFTLAQPFAHNPLLLVGETEYLGCQLHVTLGLAVDDAGGGLRDDAFGELLQAAALIAHRREVGEAVDDQHVLNPGLARELERSLVVLRQPWDRQDPP